MLRNFKARFGSSSDVLGKLYASSDDGILDLYANNVVTTRLHGNGDSYIGRKLGLGGVTPENSLTVRHSGTDTDDGILIVRADASTTMNDLLGGIGFDSTDGNIPSTITEASAYIAAYAAENQGTLDKGGYLTFGTSAINDDDDTVSTEHMRIKADGTVQFSGNIGADANEAKTIFAEVTSNNITIGGGGALVTGDILPASDDTHDLGSASAAWQDLHLEGDILMTDGGKIETAAGDITINAGGGDVFIQDNGVESARFTTAGDFNVGGTASYRGHFQDNTTSFVLNVENESTSASSDLLRMELSGKDNPGTSNTLFWIRDSNSAVYAITGDASGGTTITTSFTAGHDTVVPASKDIVPGMIVESTGQSWYKPTDKSFQTALPKCSLAKTNSSKKVFGVVAGWPIELDEDGNQLVREEQKQYVRNNYLLAPAYPNYGQNAGIPAKHWHIGTCSVGEGVIWVTNINGDIENGDLIESSQIKGYGRLQPDDVMRSCTVAKCTEDIDWDSVTDTIQHKGATYKKYLAACTFHCG